MDDLVRLTVWTAGGELHNILLWKNETKGRRSWAAFLHFLGYTKFLLCNGKLYRVPLLSLYVFSSSFLNRICVCVRFPFIPAEKQTIFGLKPTLLRLCQAYGQRATASGRGFVCTCSIFITCIDSICSERTWASTMCEQVRKQWKIKHFWNRSQILTMEIIFNHSLEDCFMFLKHISDANHSYRPQPCLDQSQDSMTTPLTFETHNVKTRGLLVPLLRSSWETNMEEDSTVWHRF